MSGSASIQLHLRIRDSESFLKAQGLTQKFHFPKIRAGISGVSKINSGPQKTSLPLTTHPSNSNSPRTKRKPTGSLFLPTFPKKFPENCNLSCPGSTQVCSLDMAEVTSAHLGPFLPVEHYPGFSSKYSYILEFVGVFSD